MVTDLYSHILDDDRRQNAQLFEDAFYSGKDGADASPSAGDSDITVLMKLLKKPEMATLIKELANSI